VRVPGWCSNATIAVNDQVQRGVKPASFFRIQRIWKNGDSVVVNLPMPVQTHAGPGRAVAINRGPLVYSLRIGEDWTVHNRNSRVPDFDEFELHATTPWNYALQLNPADAATSLVFTNLGTPANPFDPAQPPVALLAQARQLPGWTIGWRGTHAFEPPVSPVASTSPLEGVTLVPFGSQHLRISWFPYLGIPSPTTGFFKENFDPAWCERWTTFGGNWSARDGKLSTVPASANGAKAFAMATAFTNFVFEGDVSVGPAGNAGLVFRASKPDIGLDAYCGYYVGINSRNSKLAFGCVSNSWREIASAPVKFGVNRFYHLKILAQDSHIRIFVGDSTSPAIDVTDGNFSDGMIGVRDFCPDEKQSLSSFANLVATETGPGLEADQKSR